MVLRGTPLPVERSHRFNIMPTSGSDTFTLQFSIGERPLAARNTNLGQLTISGIPTDGETRELLLKCAVTAQCEVTVVASIEGTEACAEATFSLPDTLTLYEINRLIALAADSATPDGTAVDVIEASNNAADTVAQAERILRDKPDPALNKLVAAVGLAVDAGDAAGIRTATETLTEHLRDGDHTGTDGARADSSQTSYAAAETPTIGVSRDVTTIGRIFGGQTFTPDTQLCFVLMPFDSALQPVYEDHIRPAVRRLGLTCQRADEITSTSLITWDIWERINRARVIVADLTQQNANVFYELGLAHALGKDVVLLTQSMDFVPFDLKSIRCIVYEFTPRGCERLEQKLTETLSAFVKGTNS